ncbi:MAG: hypothetical protein WCI92_03005 [Bacteroidota bacterium]
MIQVPNMIMIGGNSRNAGKTTLACSIISKLAARYEVIALKVTSVRPDEADLHGNHTDESIDGYHITQEFLTDTHKDTSMMKRAGASSVFYIRADAGFEEQAILHFINQFTTDQPIICESRSLRSLVVPGLFLMTMRLPAIGKAKEVSAYISLADKVFHYDNGLSEIAQFTHDLHFENGRFFVGN